MNRPQNNSASEPQGVTVVVPTLNRGEAILPALEDLLAQHHRPLEVMVVDQSAETAEAALALARLHPEILHVHRVTFRGLPRARNYAWQHARYDAIVFVDDDIRCGPELVTEHLRALQMPGVGVVAGGIDEPLSGRRNDIPPTGKFLRWRAVPTLGWGARVEGDVDHGPGGNFSLWRHVVREVGGFDEALDCGAAIMEETECCLRAKKSGYRVYFNGSARLTHLPANSGGCRVDKPTLHVKGLAHNRALVTRRHLRFMEKLVAMGYQIRSVAGFAREARSREMLKAGWLACAAGWRQGAMPPVCADYPLGEVLRPDTPSARPPAASGAGAHRAAG